MINNRIKITECPRDAMQGFHNFIDTNLKIEYINSLLEVGFDNIDFGSFVSPKTVPQMQDTSKVLKGLDLSSTNSKLLAIVLNQRGASDASDFDEISILGFPFSISETFQQRNANSTVEDSLNRVEDIKKICDKSNKEMLIYLSMAFGNPYGDKYDSEIAAKWVEKLSQFEINTIALSDTIGSSNGNSITKLFTLMNNEFSEINFTAHLHTTPNQWKEKVEAAIESGCYSFDTAIKGFGGCPMAKDDLTGNLATENLLSYLDDNKFHHNIKKDAFNTSMLKASSVFI